MTHATELILELILVMMCDCRDLYRSPMTAEM